MIRGYAKFLCKDCGHEFEGLDIEYRGTAESQPLPCPQCGSMNTKKSHAIFKTKPLLYRR